MIFIRVWVIWRNNQIFLATVSSGMEAWELVGLYDVRLEVLWNNLDKNCECECLSITLQAIQYLFIQWSFKWMLLDRSCPRKHFSRTFHQFVAWFWETGNFIALLFNLGPRARCFVFIGKRVDLAPFFANLFTLKTNCDSESF